MHRIFDDRRYLIPFRATLLPQIFTDVLVIGAGAAGMRAALAAAETGAEVILISKGKIDESNTAWAQGGIAAVLTEQDSVEDHVQDTLAAGAELCDEPVVRQVVEDGPHQIERLLAWGMPFDKREGQASTAAHEPSQVSPERPQDVEDLAYGREGGHGRHRILHTDGDATGRALAQTLEHQVRQTPNIRIFDQCFVLDLLTLETDPASTTNQGESGDTTNHGEHGHCLGVITHHPAYGLQVIWAGATVLASGGCGQVWRESTNPSVATADGLAMAYRAGAELQDLAFMQFHPTTLYVAGASRSLITEAVRGEGGYLVDRHGHRFMPDYDQRAELAPRDVVSRAMLAQMTRTGHSHVFLDVRHLGREHFAQRFPGIMRMLERFDIDPGESTIPVHPSAHYMIGGVRTDMQGQTSLPGLFACGEVTCTALHGANRLASNSLLEGLVYGQIAGQAAATEAAGENQTTSSVEAPGGRGGGPHRYKIVSDIRPSNRSELDLTDVRSSLRSVMWRHVGIERGGDHLAEVAGMFEFWARYTLDKIFDQRLGWETQNMLTVGALITQAANWREETRGTHHRIDYPDPQPPFKVHDIWQRGRAHPQTRSNE